MFVNFQHEKKNNGIETTQTWNQFRCDEKKTKKKKKNKKIECEVEEKTQFNQTDGRGHTHTHIHKTLMMRKICRAPLVIDYMAAYLTGFHFNKEGQGERRVRERERMRFIS